MSGPILNIQRVTGDHARHVLAFLLRCGPQTFGDLKDSLAARCGSKEQVERAVHHARVKGWLTRDGRLWSVTDEGRAELAGKAAA